MVMQAAADFLVGGSNPGAANMAPESTDQDSNRRSKNSATACVTIRPGLDVIGMCLPTAWSLLSENFCPPPPLKKVFSSFRG